MKPHRIYLAIIALNFSIISINYAFVTIINDGNEIKWPENKISYSINQNVAAKCSGSKLSENETVEAIQNSFETWTTVSSVNLGADYSGKTATTNSDNDGENVIEFVGKNWSDQDFNPSSQALAVTVSSFKDNQIVDTDLFFNCSNFSWDVLEGESNGSKMDLQSIASHEVGHMLGIDHNSENPDAASSERAPIMYYASSIGEIKRDLENDDENAIRHLYPDASPAEPVVEKVSPASASNAESVKLKSLSGTNFSSTATVRLVNSDDSDHSIVIKNVSVSEDGSSLSGTIDARGAKAGTYNVVVANSAGIESTLKSAFSIFDKNGGSYYGSQSGSSLGASQASGCGYIGGQTGNADFMVLMILTFPMLIWARRWRLFARP
jgi:hypothetical protein